MARGDKRIILVDGEARGAVNRVPAGDDIRSNMVRGGAARGDGADRRASGEICARIGPELKRRGLLFVGIDVIDGYLTEINVTSPTGIRAIKRLGGPDLAVAIWDAIEARRRRKMRLVTPALPCRRGRKENIRSMSAVAAPWSNAARAPRGPLIRRKGLDRAKTARPARRPPRTAHADDAAFRRAGDRASCSRLWTRAATKRARRSRRAEPAGPARRR